GADDGVDAVLRHRRRRALEYRQPGLAGHLVRADGERLPGAELGQSDHGLPFLNGRQSAIEVRRAGLAARVEDFPGQVPTGELAFEARQDLIDVARVLRTEVAEEVEAAAHGVVGGRIVARVEKGLQGLRYRGTP